MAQPKPSELRMPDGSPVPLLGQGSWTLAKDRHPAADEEAALRLGISLGMTLLDTAEMYGDGDAEKLIARAISGQRDKVFVVSKVLPYHATPNGIRKACLASLARLGTDHLDLYLLHWRSGVTDLKPVVDTFASLQSEGRIRWWGVSNFEVPDMEELYRVRGGSDCATNQVRYSLEDRSIEAALLPWCERQGVPVMAYSPLGKGGALLRNGALRLIADRHGTAPATVALAWTIRGGHVIAIPESGQSDHVRQNAAALSLELTSQDLGEIDAAFPARSG